MTLPSLTDTQIALKEAMIAHLDEGQLNDWWERQFGTSPTRQTFEGERFALRRRAAQLGMRVETR